MNLSYFLPMQHRQFTIKQDLTIVTYMS